MEQLIFNFNEDNGIKELQLQYVKLLIKEINYGIKERNPYNFLAHIYNTIFVEDICKLKGKITPDEIVNRIIYALKKEYFSYTDKDKFIYRYVLNEQFKKLLIDHLDQIKYENEYKYYQHTTYNNKTKEEENMKPYLTILCEHYKKNNVNL